MEENVIEVCVGVGMDQFTPEYIKIVIPKDVVQNEEETLFPEKLEKANTILEETKDTLPK
mgnify:CR=1 FL=1|tara:strand:+ start:2901 stop:3080 length:180 start_codon:yes stop_codon:yes gene_type:complete